MKVISASDLPSSFYDYVGGDDVSETVREILADVLACPVTPLAEPESAALGAALQALWTLRRQAGEDVSADEVAAPFVSTAEAPTEPHVDRSAAYAELGQRFRERARALYGAT